MDNKQSIRGRPFLQKLGERKWFYRSIVLSLAFIATLIVWFDSLQHVRSRAQFRFERIVNQITADVEERFSDYMGVIEGVRSIFYMDVPIDDKELSKYLQNLHLREHYAGIHAIGLCLRMDINRQMNTTLHHYGNELKGMIEGGVIDQNVFKSVLLLPPYGMKDEQILKYDMFSDPIERVAMEKARDSGKPAATQSIRLFEGDMDRGFINYLPLYRKNQTLMTVSDRRKNLIGYIFSAFHVDDLMHDIPLWDIPDLDYKIYDRTNLNANSFLYDNEPNPPPNYHPRFKQTVVVDTGAGKWSIVFSTLPLFDSTIDFSEPYLILMGGALIGFLMLTIVWSLVTTRERALAMATQMTTDLRGSQEDLQKTNRELRDFAYVVSHDLKAPLRGISALASWIESDYSEKLDEEGKENLKLLNDRVKRMHNMIEGILQLASIGKTEAVKIKCDLNQVVKETVDLLSPPAHIRLVVANTLPSLYIEKVWIQEVFQNLISNAIKFMDKPEGLIEIGVTDDGSRWRFFVKDNGPGLEEKYYEKIFQIFQTLAPRDSVESTGIGLALVKKIVENYRGLVWVESDLGQGSTFFFTIPKSGVNRQWGS